MTPRWVNRLKWLRLKKAGDISEFKAKIASPQALGAVVRGNPMPAIVMLANAEIALRYNQATTSGQLGARMGTGDTVSPNFMESAAANKWVSIGIAEEGESVIVVSTVAIAAGTVSVAVLDEWKRPKIIATGSITV